MTDYTFTKTPVAIDSLEDAIRKSAIVTAYDHTIFNGPNSLTCTFKDTLSAGDETLLGTIVAAHNGVPLPTTPVVLDVAVQSIPDPTPFAQPTYRTKRNASGVVACALNVTTVVDFQMTSTLYVSGGMLIIENAEFGDYVTAEVYDTDGVIPAPYRAALCEAWPSVAIYVLKLFIPVRVPGSVQAGSVSQIEINTYPLNAKITPGLYLRMSYTAVNSGLGRRVGMNYYLAKKL